MKPVKTFLVSVAALGLASSVSTSATAQFQPHSSPNLTSSFAESLGWIQADAELDIVDTAIQIDSLDTFISLLNELGMAEDLRGYGRFTVFAPSDAAFAAVDDNIMSILAGDRELLAEVLAYHVIASGTPVYSEDITTTLSARTLARSEIEISESRNTVYVNGAEVIDADIEASNGVIHIIDEVLLPPDILSRLR